MVHPPHAIRPFICHYQPILLCRQHSSKYFKTSTCGAEVDPGSALRDLAFNISGIFHEFGRSSQNCQENTWTQLSNYTPFWAHVDAILFTWTRGPCELVLGITSEFRLSDLAIRNLRYRSQHPNMKYIPLP